MVANRYAALSNDGEGDWSTHTPQYNEIEKMHRRMKENRKATKWHAHNGNETNWHSLNMIAVNGYVTIKLNACTKCR